MIWLYLDILPTLYLKLTNELGETERTGIMGWPIFFFSFCAITLNITGYKEVKWGRKNIIGFLGVFFLQKFWFKNMWPFGAVSANTLSFTDLTHLLCTHFEFCWIPMHYGSTRILCLWGIANIMCAWGGKEQ